jgi:hypothetical protein
LHDQFEASRALFECLLPQLSYALPSVNAAAAALGAVYEMQTATSPSTDDSETRLVAAQYGTAIREVQRELLNRPYGPVPILVACVLLACVDVLLRRRRLALMHFRGAIKVLEERNGMSATSASGSSPMDSSGGVCNRLTPKVDPLPLEEGDDDITVFFRTLDVQTVLYADGLEPQMQIALVRTPADLASTPNSVYRAGRELIALMQACHYFTSFASQYKYCPRIFIPAELFVEQGRQIAALRLWLRGLDYTILPSIKPSADSSGTASSSKYTHGLMLRNLCLSNIIYASTILHPYETDWDVHAGDFQEIIIGAETILENRHRRRCGMPSSQSSAFTFTPSPGIIQPLFLTAMKYREPKWRRRALELLWRSGKEGPWDGKLMAAATQRTIEIEESEIARDTESSIGEGQAGARHNDARGARLANIVPEHIRICGCGPGGDVDAEGLFDWEWTKEWAFVSQGACIDRRDVSPVNFCRCRDMDKMLAEGLNGKARGEEAPWKDKRHWETWTETIEF